MDVQEQNERGLKLRVDLFGREAVDRRMNAFGDFGKPLQHIINAYAYGDVWQRPSLPPAVKSLRHRRTVSSRTPNASAILELVQPAASKARRAPGPPRRDHVNRQEPTGRRVVHRSP